MLLNICIPILCIIIIPCNLPLNSILLVYGNDSYDVPVPVSSLHKLEKSAKSSMILNIQWR